MTNAHNAASARRMNSGEKRAAIALAAIYALRMLGLFMVLPVLALHANDYSNATPFLIGLAIGVYVLTQAVLQIPFGMLSDRLGRKRVIGAGLVIFAVFTLLEATLPALVSRLVPGELKGTALGVYATSQFLGVFLAGIMGGWIDGLFGPLAVFGCASVLAVFWLVLSSRMRRPSPLSTQLLRVGSLTFEQANKLREELLSVRGVAHVVVIADEGVACLKVNRHELDHEASLPTAFWLDFHDQALNAVLRAGTITSRSTQSLQSAVDACRCLSGRYH